MFVGPFTVSLKAPLVDFDKQLFVLGGFLLEVLFEGPLELGDALTHAHRQDERYTAMLLGPGHMCPDPTKT